MNSSPREVERRYSRVRFGSALEWDVMKSNQGRKWEARLPLVGKAIAYGLFRKGDWERGPPGPHAVKRAQGPLNRTCFLALRSASRDARLETRAPRRHSPALCDCPAPKTEVGIADRASIHHALEDWIRCARSVAINVRG